MNLIEIFVIFWLSIAVITMLYAACIITTIIGQFWRSRVYKQSEAE